MNCILAVLLAMLSLSALAQKTPEHDKAKARTSIAECNRISTWKLVEDKPGTLEISCKPDHMLYHSRSRFLGGKDLRLGNFNLLHPGTDKTLFKDNKLMAELINQEFDVMAGIELVDVVADAKAKNLKIIEILNKRFKAQRESYELLLGMLTVAESSSIEDYMSPEEKDKSEVAGNETVTDMDSMLEMLVEDERAKMSSFRELAARYRIPGYLQLLVELRKLDASWSLVVAPHGDAALPSNTHELVGYYYRSTKVKLTSNPHCTKRFGKSSAACIPNFYADYMGTNFAPIISRRPFLATFNNGSSTFSLLAAHVIFEPPKTEVMQNLFREAFGVTALDQLPAGITQENFARFAEVSITMKMIAKLRAEGLSKVIYAGDLNLESQNPFWKHMFTKYPGHTILVDAPTSVSESRFVRGVESYGVASNYDHFILSNEDVGSCRGARAINFITNDFSKKIRNKYLIRNEGSRGPYSRSEDANLIIASRSVEVEAKLRNYNFIIKGSEVFPDEKTTAADKVNFLGRVFSTQLADETYYKFFVQVMSDHFPIRLDCSF